MRNHSYENEVDLYKNEPAGGTHFHMNGFALKLVLKHKKTRKWPMLSSTLFEKTETEVYSMKDKSPQSIHKKCDFLNQ